MIPELQLALPYEQVNPSVYVGKVQKMEKEGNHEDFQLGKYLHGSTNYHRSNSAPAKA
jgi:hypothetical protein